MPARSVGPALQCLCHLSALPMSTSLLRRCNKEPLLETVPVCQMERVRTWPHVASYLGTVVWEPPCSHSRCNRGRQSVSGSDTREGGACMDSGWLWLEKAGRERRYRSRRVTNAREGRTTGTRSLWFSCRRWAPPPWHRRSRRCLRWHQVPEWLSNSPRLKQRRHTHTDPHFSQMCI